MRKWMWILALGALALAQDVPEEEIVEEEIAESAYRSGRIATGGAGKPIIGVQLREGGTLFVRTDKAWKRISLDGLSKALQARKKPAALEDLGSGVKAVRTRVSIEAHPQTPWQHLQWLMTICAEEKYYRLQLIEGDRKFLVELPVDIAICGGEATDRVRLGIHILNRAAKEATWGSVVVQRPTLVRYKVNGRELANLKELGELMAKAAQVVKDGNKDNELLTEIKAGYRTPFVEVMRVLEVAVAKKVTNLEFFGTAIPSPRLRAADPLPYPKKDYLGEKR